MIYFNEKLFLVHIFSISTIVLIGLRMGKNALIALMSVFVITMNLFITKQIELFGLSLTATDSFTVGIGLIVNLLQEYWNRETAVKAIKISFFISAVFVIMSTFHLAYNPHCNDTLHENFDAILSWTPRIIAASLVTFLVTQLIDTKLYAYMLKKFNKRYFLLRNYGSLLISQVVDTVLFTFLGLYGIVYDVKAIIIVSFIMKAISILIATPYIAMTRRFIIEKKD